MPPEPRKIPAAWVTCLREEIKRAHEDAPGDIIAHLAQVLGLSREETEKRIPALSIERKEKRALRSWVREKVFQSLVSQGLQEGGVTERWIKRYWHYAVRDSSLRGHVEAPHGQKPGIATQEATKQLGISSDEPGTIEIAKGTSNWMVAVQPRTTVDVNHLPSGQMGSIYIEGGRGIALENNRSAIEAQQEVTRGVLGKQGNLDKQHQAKKPYLVICVHGKTDQRGHDFEIGAAPKLEGRTPLDPRIALWFTERLQEKIEERELFRENGKLMTVNVVTYGGAYSGSPALTRMRHGDIDFQGFGENYNALQLEIGRYARDTHQKLLSEILEEILKEFSVTFQTSQDLEQYNVHRETYKIQQRAEKEAIFDKNKIFFNDQAMPSEILLVRIAREALGLEVGENIRIGGQTLIVRKMPMDLIRSSYTMVLHSHWKDKIEDSLDIQRESETVTGT